VGVILKRMSREDFRANLITVGYLTINLDLSTVTYKGVELILQRRKNDLLLCLCKNIGKALSRDQLLDLVWGYDYDGNDRAVDICVQRLRSKLKGTNVSIKTIWGTGYRMEIIK
jgi:DNA-binding response OmpR family regulator